MTRLCLPLRIRVGGPGLGGILIAGRQGGPSGWRWMLTWHPGHRMRPRYRWGYLRPYRKNGMIYSDLMLGRLGWLVWIKTPARSA